mgnify:CR=1 FL=1
MSKKSRTITVTAAVNKQESDAIREFCSQFEMNMGDLVRELIFYALDNAPIKNEMPILVLDDLRIPFNVDTRNLRGVRPGTKRRSG